MARWPHDDPASLAAFYGDPDKGEPGRHLVPVVPPFRMYYDGKPIGAIQFHRKAAPALKAALDEIWEKCGKSQARVDAAGVSVFSGAYNPRKIRGSATRWSNHAYGAAIDFDAEHNGFNTGHGRMPDFVVAAFKRQGALWGGDYRGRTDPMHFEFCSREPVVRPVGLMGDGHGDEPDDDPPAAPAAPSAGGFFSRVRNWVTTAFTGGGFLGLGALTEWKIAALLFGFILLGMLLSLGFAFWLFGKAAVRDWFARNLA